MRRLLITAAAALTLLAGCGGVDLGPESGSTTATSATTYPTTGTTTTTTSSTTTIYEMGNGSGSSFEPGVIGLSSASISACSRGISGESSGAARALVKINSL